MKRIFILIAFVFTTTSFPAVADINLSISIGEPSFYGIIDIGNAPPPVLYYTKPTLITVVPGVTVLPLYLRVPADYRKDWRHHCAEFKACGRPVYFVTDEWYTNIYAPHYKKHHEYYQGRHDYEKKHEHEHEHEHGHGH
jgi:hypothetical protein